MPILTFGSLFAGIGGFDLGFERAGMECRGQVEIDPYALRVLGKHWPNVPKFTDIRTFAREYDESLRVDVICGGFPCQDISYAGAGAGLDGARSGLFFEAIRVVQQLRPRIVVLENVAALLTRGLDRVLGTLAQIRYDAEWHCIPAAAIGAPHIRDRVWVVAYSASNGDSEFKQSHKRKNRTGKKRTGGFDINGGVHRSGNVSSANIPRLERQRIIASGTEPQFNDIGDPCWWEAEPDVGRVADGVPARVDRLRGLGNALVPQVAEWIGRRIVNASS